jgi:23S rRNA (cytosine1962-C5)-methyltransferase
MKVAKNWKDYEIIATGSGEKLERWKDIYLLRPDPQIIWKSSFDLASYDKLNAKYERSSSGGGKWNIKKSFSEEWTVSYKNLTFSIKPMGFKHTGLFPEQAANWDIMMDLIRNSNRPIKVLNLFAYTGGATVACASAGASVCHVDCVKQIVERAKTNAALSGLENANIRYIVDDCKKFVEREIRRGNKYDAIIMDPPSFGRSGASSVWKLEDDLYDFVSLCCKILVPNPLFVLINSYTTGLGETVTENILRLCLKNKTGKFDSYELGLPTQEGINLPCGCSAIYIGE